MNTITYEYRLTEISMYEPELDSGEINNLITFSDNNFDKNNIRFNFTNWRNIMFDLNTWTYTLGWFNFSFNRNPFELGYFINLFKDNNNFWEIENISMDKRFKILFSENKNCIYEQIWNTKYNLCTILE